MEPCCREHEVAVQKQDRGSRGGMRKRKGGRGKDIHTVIFFLISAFQTYIDRNNFRNIKYLYIFLGKCFEEQSLSSLLLMTIH